MAADRQARAEAAVDPAPEPRTDRCRAAQAARGSRGSGDEEHGTIGQVVSADTHAGGRKRAADESCPAEQPNGGKCEASVQPNSVGLADGTIYNISDLADDKVEELVSFVQRRDDVWTGC